MTMVKMLIRLQVRSLLSVLLALMALLLLVDFLETARHLLGGKSNFSLALTFYACRAVAMLYLILPVALVVGTFVAFAKLGRNLELRSLAAAGIGPFQLLRPVALVSALVLGLVFILGELAVPPAYDALEKLMSSKIGRIDSSWRFFRSHMWVKGEGERLIRTGKRSPDGKKLRGVLILEMNDEFQVVKRVDARTASFVDGSWQCQGVAQRHFEDERQVDYQYSTRAVMNWPEKPSLFLDLSGRPQQKSLLDLSSTIAALENRGLAAQEYLLAWHNRFAFPLVGFLLLVLAWPWLVRPDRRRTVAAALFESSLMVFCSYFVVSMFSSAVSGGSLAAGLGAWIPLALIALLCLPPWLRMCRRSRLGRAT